MYYMETLSSRILVETLLSKNFDELFTQCKRKFSLKTALMFLEQALNRLEFLHANGVLCWSNYRVVHTSRHQARKLYDRAASERESDLFDRLRAEHGYLRRTEGAHQVEARVAAGRHCEVCVAGKKDSRRFVLIRGTRRAERATSNRSDTWWFTFSRVPCPGWTSRPARRRSAFTW